jgi:hypothetical protein
MSFAVFYGVPKIALLAYRNRYWGVGIFYRIFKESAKKVPKVLIYNNDKIVARILHSCFWKEIVLE